MASLKNVRHEKFAQFVASGLTGADAYRPVPPVEGRKCLQRGVRVFPILQVDGHVPDYAEHGYESLRSKKIEVSFVCVPPTLHKGADRLLVLQR